MIDRSSSTAAKSSAVGGGVQRLGRAPKIARPGESNEAVSQVLPLQQEKTQRR
jgi:hypothetical protein